MTRTEAILEMTDLMKAHCDYYHIDFHKYKMTEVRTEFDPMPGPCSTKTLWTIWRSKTNESWMEAWMEYYPNDQTIGYHKIMLK